MMDKTGSLPINNVQTRIYCDFSHGSPGAIPLLTLASEIFPDLTSTCLKVAVQAGEFAWANIDLLKTKWLSLGIAGIGYLLHNLYRALLKMSEQASNSFIKDLY